MMYAVCSNKVLCKIVSDKFGTVASSASRDMFISKMRFRVEWGDCDPADIVFYPQYLRWFDACTTSLFENAGLSLPDLFKEHGIIGIPVVDLKVRFIVSSGFGDKLEAESSVVEWRRSSFAIQHRFLKGKVLAVEGVETRVWTGIDPENPDRMKSRPVPKEVIERFS
jgi:4-hydroxybenzoyl-CoA thioesterase